jgi:hypothetical protein
LTITKENTIENVIRVIGLWAKKCGDSALFFAHRLARPGA